MKILYLENDRLTQLEAYELYVADYITKPFSQNILLNQHINKDQL